MIGNIYDEREAPVFDPMFEQYLRSKYGGPIQTNIRREKNTNKQKEELIKKFIELQIQKETQQTAPKALSTLTSASSTTHINNKPVTFKVEKIR